MPPPPSTRALLLARCLPTRRSSIRPHSSVAAFPGRGRLLDGEFKDHQTFENNKNCHQGEKISLGTSWCFAAAGLLAFSTMSAGSFALYLEEERNNDADVHQSPMRKPRVIFVLGGPGSGKGTQCTKTVDRYGFTHLSAGDLLRAEISSGSKDGMMIQNMIKEGKIVPSEVTVKLLQKAMNESSNDKFLIDGFPRNDENRASFENLTGIQPEFVLFFDCPEEEMERRLLSRNQGREDDNLETVKKRFKVYTESTLPVIQYYESMGKVKKINASGTIDEVSKSLEHLFVPFVQEDLLQLTRELLKSIDEGDYGTYTKLCDSALTAFEPEAKGHLIEGLEFHKFYFAAKRPSSSAPAPVVRSEISSPKVTLLGDDVGIVIYTRLLQNMATRYLDAVKPTNETRVWQRKKNSNGQWEWKNVHFHRSKAPRW